MPMSERERIEDEHGAGAALGMLMAFLMMLCLGGCVTPKEITVWRARACGETPLHVTADKCVCRPSGGEQP